MSVPEQQIFGSLPLLFILCASCVVVWLVSLVLEALRPIPKAPETLPWDPSLKPVYATVDGVKLRYLKVGAGPVLLLLHTLRTQLDLFHKVIPELAKDFTVYALDYPGHGYSDIPAGLYDSGFFVIGEWFSPSSSAPAANARRYPQWMGQSNA